MALAPYAEPFMHGVIQRRLSEVFGKYFEYDLKFLSDLTISGYGFSTWYWLLKFNEKARAGWICGLGHGILKETPEENVKTFVKEIREAFA